MSGSQTESTPGISKRLDYVAALRVILIILVVSHHGVEPYAQQPAPEAILPDEPTFGLWSFLWMNAAFFGKRFFVSAPLWI